MINHFHQKLEIHHGITAESHLVTTKVAYISFSHSRDASTEITKHINDYLVNLGVTTYYVTNYEEIHGELRAEVTKLIDNSLCFICFMSEKYMKHLLSSDHYDALYCEFHAGNVVNTFVVPKYKCVCVHRNY